MQNIYGLSNGSQNAIRIDTLLSQYAAERSPETRAAIREELRSLGVVIPTEVRSISSICLNRLIAHRDIVTAERESLQTLVRAIRIIYLTYIEMALMKNLNRYNSQRGIELLESAQFSNGRPTGIEVATLAMLIIVRQLMYTIR